MEMRSWNRRNTGNQSGWTTSGESHRLLGLSRLIVASYTLARGHVDFRMMALALAGNGEALISPVRSQANRRSLEQWRRTLPRVPLQ